MLHSQAQRFGDGGEGGEGGDKTAHVEAQCVRVAANCKVTFIKSDLTRFGMLNVEANFFHEKSSYAFWYVECKSKLLAVTASLW